MKPPLSASHGTSLATTAGITAVITAVVALAVLGQCGSSSTGRLGIAVGALISLTLAAGALYLARNAIGEALDSSADARVAGIAAARGLTLFHFGMAGVFAGLGLAAAFRLPFDGAAWSLIAPGVAGVAAIAALVRAAGWWREGARRGRSVG